MQTDSGGLQPILPIPEIPGLEGSGIIVEIGANAKEAQQLKIGDPVCFLINPRVCQQGCYAEYVVVEDKSIALKPENIGTIIQNFNFN